MRLELSVGLLSEGFESVRKGEKGCMCNLRHIIILSAFLSPVDKEPDFLSFLAQTRGKEGRTLDRSEKAIVQQSRESHKHAERERGSGLDGHFNRPTLHFYRPPLLVFLFRCITRCQPPTSNQRPPPAFLTQTPIVRVPIPDRNLQNVETGGDD